MALSGELEQCSAEVSGYVLTEQVGHRLRRAHQRATAIFLSAIGDPQLTPTQWAALVALRDEGMLSQNQLGRLTCMDPATTQGVLIRLGERDLVERLPDLKDRRRTSVRLTPKGKATVAALTANAQEINARTLAPLSAEEQEQFMALLARLM